MTPEILGDLIIKKVGDSDWELQSPIEFRLSNGRIAIAQRGFRLDFGSTGIFGGVAPSLGSSADFGYCLHDLLYATHRDGDDTWTREDADGAMLEMHQHCGVDTVIAKAVYAAVRGFALFAWESPEEKLEREIRVDDTFLDG